LIRQVHMTGDKKKQGPYTCADYRSEMILLGLTRRLQEDELDSRQADDLRRQIKALRAEMGMD
jgi:hypothetical protein